MHSNRQECTAEKAAAQLSWDGCNSEKVMTLRACFRHAICFEIIGDVQHVVAPVLFCKTQKQKSLHSVQSAIAESTIAMFQQWLK